MHPTEAAQDSFSLLGIYFIGTGAQGRWHDFPMEGPGRRTSLRNGDKEESAGKSFRVPRWYDTNELSSLRPQAMMQTSLLGDWFVFCTQSLIKAIPPRATGHVFFTVLVIDRDSER